MSKTKRVKNAHFNKGAKMGIPDFQSFFKPLLDLASDQKEHSVNETREAMSKKMNLSEEDLQDLFEEE